LTPRMSLQVAAGASKLFGGETRGGRRGSSLDIKFSRVAILSVYLDVFLTEATGYIGDTAVKDYIVAQRNVSTS